MTSWFRSWHGAPTDKKFLTVAKKAGVAPGIVSAIFWALTDYASQHEDRGSIEGFDIEDYSVWSGFDESQIAAVCAALKDKGVILDNRLKSWEKRQPKREDDGAAERKRKQRDNDTSRNVTQCHAPEKIQNTDTETDIKNNNYVFPFSGEAFNGQVIQMDAKSFNLWFQRYSFGDEHKFREMIANRDQWYSTQPYNVYRDEKWLRQTTTWLAKNAAKKKNINGDFKSLRSYV